MIKKKYIVETSFFIIYLISILVLIFSMASENNDIKTYHFTGDSMNPTIKNNTFIKCRKDYENLSVGDIIVFEESKINYTVVHRIVHKYNSTHYRTKGDNNKNHDNYIVDKSEVKCKKIN